MVADEISPHSLSKRDQESGYRPFLATSGEKQTLPYDIWTLSSSSSQEADVFPENGRYKKVDPSSPSHSVDTQYSEVEVPSYKAEIDGIKVPNLSCGRCGFGLYLPSAPSKLPCPCPECKLFIQDRSEYYRHIESHIRRLIAEPSYHLCRRCKVSRPFIQSEAGHLVKLVGDLSQEALPIRTKKGPKAVAKLQEEADRDWEWGEAIKERRKQERTEEMEKKKRKKEQKEKEKREEERKEKEKRKREEERKKEKEIREEERRKKEKEERKREKRERERRQRREEERQERELEDRRMAQRRREREQASRYGLGGWNLARATWGR